MTHYLVVAHQTATSPELIRCASNLAAEEPKATFTILVPATPVDHLLTWEEGETQSIAERKAEDAKALFEQRGLIVVDTKVGDASPILAIGDELRSRPDQYGGIVLSTLPPGVSRWLRLDVNTQAERKFGIPVVQVVSGRPVKVNANELRNIDIFEHLSDREIAIIAAVGSSVRIPLGTPLAKQEDSATNVYVVLEGQVGLTRSSPQGEITVRIVGPGESFPLAALLGSGTLITTAYAMTDLRAVAFSRDTLWGLLIQEPAIGLKVYKAVADILGGRYQNTLSRLVGTIDQASINSDVFANV